MAQSVIGALRVSLGLDSARFEAGARRVRDPLRDMRRQFQRVAAAAAAFGAAISAAALSGAREIDETSKAARRLGTDIGGFRALELAAQEAGVSINTMTDGIQTMDRELARNSAGAQRALDRLRISAADLAGLDAPDRVALIADSVRELGLSAGEATALLADLGIRSREMTLLMLQGGDAIRRARSDVQSYGLALSNVDARRIEEARDAIGRLGLISQYARQRIALELVPAMGRLADAMSESLREGGRLRAVIDTLADNVQRVTVYVATATAVVGVRFVGALVAARIAALSLSGALVALGTAVRRVAIAALVVGAAELVYQFGRLVHATGSVGEAIGAMGEMWHGVFEAMKASADSFGVALSGVWLMVKQGFFQMVADIQWRWSELLGNMATSARNIPFLGEGLADRLAAEARAAMDSWEDMHNAARETGRNLERTYARADELQTTWTEGIERARSALDTLRDTLDAVEIDTDGAAEAARRLNEALEEIGGAGGGGAGAGGSAAAAAEGIRAIGEAADQVGRFVDTLSNGLANAFAGMITGAQSAKEAIAQLARQLAQMLANQAFQMLFGAMFGGFGGRGFNTGFGGGQLPGFYASGTPSARRGLAWVGEEGPELVDFSGGERVYNNRDSQRMAAPQVHNHLRNINVLDPSIVGDWLATPQGETLIVNVMRKNGFQPT